MMVSLLHQTPSLESKVAMKVVMTAFLLHQPPSLESKVEMKVLS
jgi:hypothetical protein